MCHEWWGWSINYYACVTDISCSDLFSFWSAKRLRGWEYMCWHVRVNFMYAEDKYYPNYENNNNRSIKWWFGKNLLHHWRLILSVFGESFVQERLYKEAFSLVLACQLQFYTVKGVVVYCFISSHNNRHNNERMIRKIKTKCYCYIYCYVIIYESSK